jgi:RND family efflux transporter MFP subunit
VTLPANVDAFETTLLHARVNGYLLRWHADIGDRVQKGQALAEIDTPEADQELLQARANLIQGRADLDTASAELEEAKAGLKQADADIARAQANVVCARSILARNEQLIEKRMVSAQELDENRRDAAARQADVEAATAQRKTREASIVTDAAKIKSRAATVNSLEANVRRLEQLQEFKTIRAPFDGVVTQRRAEIGMLVNAGSAAAAGELFAMAQSDTLRIRLCVPQGQAMSVAIGQKAEVAVPEYPGRVFTATVARTSRSIDPVSRTLMVELELPNADRALLPGTFAQVTLQVHQAGPTCTIPAGVLLSRPDGLEVAVVDGGVVRLRKVKLGRDYGGSVEVLSGLRGQETLVTNPPDDLVDNEKVSIAATSGSPDSAAAPAVASHDQPKAGS